jgi:thiamine biosynthesis lipoprotein
MYSFLWLKFTDKHLIKTETLYRTFTCFLCGLLIMICSHAQLKKYHFSASKMGSPFTIVMVSNDSLKAAELAKKSYELVDSFNHIFSDYESESEIGLLNNYTGTQAQKISPALWDVLMISGKAYQKSKASFDITVGPLSSIWRKARKEKGFPSNALILEKRKLVGFKKLKFDTAKRQLTIFPGMRLDLGGVAKGYIAQQVVDFLRKNGITQALADAGGDMVMSNAPGDTKGWVIGVNIPETTDELLPRKLQLSNMAVATSGDAYQYFEKDGIKYSHIIDPRTGYGITSQRNVTVIAGNGADADWLATACSILSIDEAKKLAVSMRAELLITVLEKGKVVYYSTKGFARFWKL